jgi:hypothetical protein
MGLSTGGRRATIGRFNVGGKEMNYFSEYSSAVTTANRFADRINSHANNAFIFLMGVVGTPAHEDMIVFLDGFAFDAEGDDRKAVIRDLYEALVESL